MAAALVAAACASGPAPEPGPAPAPAEAAAPAAGAPHAAADVRFMQEMIAHHAQALEMAGLVPGRTGRAVIERLAERIRASQIAEIGRMRRWLEARGLPVPDTAAAHTGHADHGGMPGMATPEELARLAVLSGDRFDRMFLELMIRHHEGALTMVADLREGGGGQEPEVFMLASEVDADQRAEIARMRRILTTLDQGSR